MQIGKVQQSVKKGLKFWQDQIQIESMLHEQHSMIMLNLKKFNWIKSFDGIFIFYLIGWVGLGGTVAHYCITLYLMINYPRWAFICAHRASIRCTILDQRSERAEKSLAANLTHIVRSPSTRTLKSVNCTVECGLWMDGDHLLCQNWDPIFSVKRGPSPIPDNRHFFQPNQFFTKFFSTQKGVRKSGQNGSHKNS